MVGTLRRWTAILLVWAGVAGALPATGHVETGRSLPGPAVDVPRILVVAGGVDNAVWGAMREGIVGAASALAVDVEIPLVVGGSSERIRDEQINQLESAVTRGFDAVLLVPSDAAALAPYADEVIAAGVPLIAVYRPLGEGVTAVVSDSHGSGVWLAERVTERAGVRPIVATVVGPGTDGRVGTAMRERIAELDAGARLLPVITVASSREVGPIAEDLIFSHRGLGPLLVEGGESLLAAVDYTRFDPSVLLVGVGSGTEVIDLWERGVVELLVVPDAWELGYRAVETLESLRRGESFGQEVSVPAILLDHRAVLNEQTRQSLERMDR